MFFPSSLALSCLCELRCGPVQRDPYLLHKSVASHKLLTPFATVRDSQMCVQCVRVRKKKKRNPQLNFLEVLSENPSVLSQGALLCVHFIYELE